MLKLFSLILLNIALNAALPAPKPQDLGDPKVDIVKAIAGIQIKYKIAFE